MQKTLERILWVLAIAGLAAGAYGLYLRFSVGHEMAAYGSYVPWGLWIAAYVALVGASAGAVGVAAVIYMAKKVDYYPIARVALLVALATFVAGMLNVALDLGHPFRAWKLLTRTSWTSVMGWMAWFYLVYGLLLVGGLWATRGGRRSPLVERFAPIVFLFALAFAGAEGALFGVVGARGAWESGLTPVLFLVEGAIFGLGFVLAASYVAGFLTPARAAQLGGILLALLGLFIVVEWAEFSTGLYASIPGKSQTLASVLSGPYWWVFWLLHVGLGIVVPALLLLFARGKPAAVGVAGLLAGAMGLASKINLVVPALAQENIDGLGDAFSGPGLTYSYVPTSGEWLVLLFTVSLALLVYLAGAALVQLMRAREVA